MCVFPVAVTRVRVDTVVVNGRVYELRCGSISVYSENETNLLRPAFLIEF